MILQRTNFIKSIYTQKYPLLITLVFFLIIVSVDIFYHNYWFENDGIFFFRLGEQIVAGEGENVKTLDAPVGGTVIYGMLNLILKDGFTTVKIISVLSGTGIVFLSYYITRNIFNSKISLAVQLFIAFNPRIILDSVQAMNELLPIFLILVSLYFITKKDLKLYDLMVCGIFLGISSTIRFQGLAVLISLSIFLLIRSKQIKINLLYILMLTVFFIIAFSPLLIYNQYTHGNFLDSNSNFYMLTNWKYQTPEWRQSVQDNIVTEKSEGMLLDPILFLKNYFYNLLYHNPNKLFNFNSINNISIIPQIPFLGIIPFMGGLFYLMRKNMNRTNITVLIGISLVTTFFVFLFSELETYFFAIIIIPVLVIVVLNIREFPRNFLPLIFLSTVFFLIISVIPVGKADHLLAMLIVIPILSSIFFIEVIPRILIKIKLIKHFENETIHKTSIFIIVIFLAANLVFSYVLMYYLLHNEATYGNLKDEFLKLLKKREPSRESGFEYKQIGDILSKQPGIENSYVMGSGTSYTHYAHSKMLYATFQEGVKNDSLNKFITRENWTPYDLFMSNIVSYPSDRLDIYHPIPDYLIYNPPRPNTIDPWNINNTQFENLKILSNPDDPRIPTNFELLFKSNFTGTVVYKINHGN